MYNIILCEGETDAILISYYLEKTLHYKHDKQLSRDMPKLSMVEVLNGYKDDNGSCLAIGSIGGNDFQGVVNEVMQYNSMADLQETFQKIALVMDNDDESVNSSIRSIGVSLECKKNLSAGTWETFQYKNDFVESACGEIACILQPHDEYGALETFVLKAFCNRDKGIKHVVDQVKTFIGKFQSDKYLKRRRDRTKAELSVSLSVLYPSKTFTPIDKMLKSVKWEEYELFQQQFSLFAHLNENNNIKG